MEAKKSLSSIESKQRGFGKVIEMDKITFDGTEYILSKSKLLGTAFNYINSELKIIIEKKKALSEGDLLSNLLGRNSSENNSANNNSNNTCSGTKPTGEGVFLSIDEKKGNYNTWHYVEGTKSDWNCAWKCEVGYIKEGNGCIIDNGEESNSKIYSKGLFKLTYNGRDYYYSDGKDKYCSFITSQVVPNFSQEEQKNN